MKAIEQYFPVVLSVMPDEVIPIGGLIVTFLNSCKSDTIQMTATESYFPQCCCLIVPYKEVLCFSVCG